MDAGRPLNRRGSLDRALALHYQFRAKRKGPTAMEARPRTVLCMKWGTLYGPDYVNVLHAACRANITGPFRFVCLTTDGDGLDRGVEVHPIPDFGFTERHYAAGAWPKLSVFARDLCGLSGRGLFIDLDSAVVGPLDPLFEMAGDFIAIAGGPGWRPGSANPAPRLASGVFAFDIGALGPVLDAFTADPAGALTVAGNEQEFIERQLGSGWTRWPHDWVISYKRHLMRRFCGDVIGPHRRPPAGTRIVAFHGDPRPQDLLRPGLAGRFPHLVRAPVAWFRDYWTGHGGKLARAGQDGSRE